MFPQGATDSSCHADSLGSMQKLIDMCMMERYETFEDAMIDDDQDNQDLCTLPEVQKDRQGPEIKIAQRNHEHSGAANNVMPRSMIRAKSNMRPSPSSIKGVHYVAANNGRIPNEGEFDFKFATLEGHEEAMVFQVAEVNKALGSVSYLVDNGCKVIFNKDAASGRDLSHMIHKASGRTTRYRRDRNI